jgi:hypothetical protein
VLGRGVLLSEAERRCGLTFPDLGSSLIESWTKMAMKSMLFPVQ